MGTYGTATGLVLVVPATGAPGKLLGLLDGELQAYFDSDGKIKWAGGIGVLDETGLTLRATIGKYEGSGLTWVDALNVPIFSIGPAVDEGAITGLQIEGLHATGLRIIASEGALQLASHAGYIDVLFNRVVNVANATADEDALNRRTGDARYIKNASDTARGWVELAISGEAAAGTDTERAVTPAGLPLRVVGSGWALKQADGSAPGGDARGTAAVDLQATRTADTQVASGAYAVVGGGYQNTASGTNATVPGGRLNTASGNYSTALGYRSSADKYGQIAHANGFFVASGDRQRGVYTLGGTTANATPTILTLDVIGDYLLTIADDTVWNFRAEIAAMTADAAKYAAYTVTGLIRRANGTVTVHGVATATIAESDAGWDVTAVADDTNKALSITVTGAAATTIRWVASVYTTEVSFPGA